MRIFITGGTGLIGTRLVRRLRQRHDDVLVLTRRANETRERLGADCTIVEGDPTQAGEWISAVDNCDAVINLAGENIFHHRWSEDVKALIRDSRVKSTDNVVQALAKRSRSSSASQSVLINASAVGIYGPHGDETITEDDPPGNDFLARCCTDWEQAARLAESLGVRVAMIRTGVVLDKAGGALAQMLTPFKFFVGGPVGSGRQWMSWIHHEDLVGIYMLALDDASAVGPINGTAPSPVTNKEFSHALGKALHRPSFLPTPKFALRLMLGEVANVVTTGQRVLPAKATRLGYPFRFPDINGSLEDIFAEPQAPRPSVEEDTLVRAMANQPPWAD